jgi:hypothetical protein
MFCLGCEMGTTEQHEDKWRSLIAELEGLQRHHHYIQTTEKKTR